MWLGYLYCSWQVFADSLKAFLKQVPLEFFLETLFQKRDKYFLGPENLKNVGLDTPNSPARGLGF